jgi:hypothetical protein
MNYRICAVTLTVMACGSVVIAQDTGQSGTPKTNPKTTTKTTTTKTKTASSANTVNWTDLAKGGKLPYGNNVTLKGQLSDLQCGSTLRANMDETDLLVVITEQGENRNPCEEQRNIFGHSSFPHGFARRCAT